MLFNSNLLFVYSLFYAQFVMTSVTSSNIFTPVSLFLLLQLLHELMTNVVFKKHQCSDKEFWKPISIIIFIIIIVIVIIITVNIIVIIIIVVVIII